MHTHMSEEKQNNETLQDVMLFEMLSALSEAYFALKVKEIIADKNPDVYSWEYEVNDRLRFFHMEGMFDGEMGTYCTVKLLYEHAYGKLPDKLEKAIKKSAEIVAERKLSDYGWKEKKEE